MFCALLLYNVNSLLSDIYNHGGGGGLQGKAGLFRGFPETSKRIKYKSRLKNSSLNPRWKLPLSLQRFALLTRVIPIGLCY